MIIVAMAEKTEKDRMLVMQIRVMNDVTKGLYEYFARDSFSVG